MSEKPAGEKTSGMSRRNFVKTLAAGTVGAATMDLAHAAGAPAASSAGRGTGAPGAGSSDFKVTTLGTGAPPPEMERFGPSTLVEAAGQYLLFDVGRGALQRLTQLGVPASAINRVFITHLHSDHTVGLPDLYLTGMLPGPFGSRRGPFRITGVEGTRKMMDHMKLAFSADSEIRVNDGELQWAWTEIETAEFTEDGVVYEKDDVKVTAFENFHGEAVKPSFGFRIDYDGRSAVISGDTKYYPNVVKYATGVDLLIHSVGAANVDLLKQDTDAAKRSRIVLNHHTPPEDAARVFNEAKPRLAVFTHMVILAFDPKNYPRPTQESMVKSTRAAGYSGPLEIARDLMSFEIGDTVRVVPFGGQEKSS
jgi:ribonuclease Z